MKKGLTIFLQGFIVALGIGVLALMLWEPHVEGVNARATTLYEIYFDDPFLMLVYTGSIPFFIALYQAIKVLRYVGQNRPFSPAAMNALRIIKYCAIVIMGFVVAEEILIMINHGSDDAAGGIMVGVFIVFGSIMTAIATAMFEKVWRSS